MENFFDLVSSFDFWRAAIICTALVAFIISSAINSFWEILDCPPAHKFFGNTQGHWPSVFRSPLERIVCVVLLLGIGSIAFEEIVVSFPIILAVTLGTLAGAVITGLILYFGESAVFFVTGMFIGISSLLMLIYGLFMDLSRPIRKLWA